MARSLEAVPRRALGPENEAEAPGPSGGEVRDAFAEQTQQTRKEARNTLGRMERFGLWIRNVKESAPLVAREAWANIQNFVGKPRRDFLEGRKDRAEERLQKRQDRHDTKRQAENSKLETLQAQLDDYAQMQDEVNQQWIDRSPNDAIRERREKIVSDRRNAREKDAQSRIDRLSIKHHNREMKSNLRISTFETRRVAPKREAYQKIAGAYEDRTDAVEQSKLEREANSHFNREAAIKAKKAALARKELRHELSTNQRLDKQEVADVLAALSSEDKLRLGSLVVARDRSGEGLRDAEVSLKRVERSLDRTKALIPKAEARIVELDNTITSNTANIASLKESLREIESLPEEPESSTDGGFLDNAMNRRRGEMSQIQNQIAVLENANRRHEMQQKRLREKIENARKQIPELEEALAAAASRRNEAYGEFTKSTDEFRDAVDDILGVQPDLVGAELEEDNNAELEKEPRAA